MNKLLIITGPTATGKTGLGIALAKKFNGEIISADSRQVYKYMDIGTGKDKEKYGSVKVWGIDLVTPDYNFNVSDYVKFARPVIADIQKRNKLPIVVGGTALYIKALLEPFETIDIPQNQELRTKLSSDSVSDLQKLLQKLDMTKWQKMNASDRNNPRRLIRAIEVTCHPERLAKRTVEGSRPNDVLLISLTASFDYLNKKIDQRVEQRIQQGAAQEVQNLLKMGYTFDLPSMTAFGYKDFNNWQASEHAYAKRQVTFIKKLPTTQVSIEESGWQEKVSQLVGEWYSDNK